jgi:ribosome-associated toxin RatA of RatAB toxin-antitoxin module
MGSARAVESIVVEVAPEEFYKILTGYEEMPTFIEGLDKIRVDSRDGKSVVVTYFVTVMARQIQYTLRLTHESEREISWKLVSGEFMKENSGRWLLEEAGKGRTKATYELQMGFGMLVPGAVVSQLQKTSLPKMLQQYKAHAEKKAGK